MKEYPYERFLRDSRINMIFEGTNEILRLFISLDSIKNVGIELKKLLDSLKRNPLAGVFKVIGASLKKCRGKFCCCDAMLPGLDPALKVYNKKAAILTKKFSRRVEKAAMKYGRKIVEKEFMQERLSDIAINLYAVYCVIARVQHLIEAKGNPAVEKELNILDAFFGRVSSHIEKDLNGIFKNKDKVLSAISDKIISG
jgi:acyl-CoA dehydrogenase family protein 9